MSTKILLADDSITIQKVISIIFGGDEYSLTIVDNGKAAFEKALEISPDVLLIDALMPGVSGYEVCERLKATPELASKPILLLTGSFEPFDEGKAKECGADDFIAKPFESQQIIAKVAELCERALSSTPSPEAVLEEAAPEEFQVIEPLVDSAEDLTPSEDVWEAFSLSDSPLEDSVDESADSSFEIQESEPLESPWMPVNENTLGLATDESVEILVPEAMAFPDEAPVASLKSESAGAAASSAPLSEEQLRAAITAASRDVIERIVWEVVPDLAETMIKKVIREITESKQ